MKKLIFLVLLFLFIPILFLGFSTDGQVYAYMGRLVVAGGIPYVDGWDHKGISMYFINALGYLIGFKSILGIKMLEFFLIVFTFLPMYSVIEKKHSKTIAFISLLFGLFTLKYFLRGGNFTEEYGLIFVLISLSLFLKKELKTIDYALIGLLFIVNLTLRANLISFWIAVFFVYCVQLFSKKISLKDFFISFVKMAYGAVFISTVYLIYFISTESLQDFIDAAFLFNFSYSEASLTRKTVLEAILTSVSRYYLSFIFLVGFILSVMRFRKDKTKRLELLLIFWIPLELYFSNMATKLYPHYFILWVPLVILSCIVTINEVKERFNFSDKKILIASSLVFIACFYIPIYRSFRDYKLMIDPKMTPTEEVAQYIMDHYKNSSLLVWGNNCDLYNLTEKLSPISFFYQNTFRFDTALMRIKIKEFTQQIIKEKPELIIGSKTNGWLNLDRIMHEELGDSYRRNLQEFVAVLKTNYVLKEEKFGVEFYVLKE